jgi:hypothetical protein
MEPSYTLSFVRGENWNVQSKQPHQKLEVEPGQHFEANLECLKQVDKLDQPTSFPKLPLQKYCMYLLDEVRFVLARDRTPCKFAVCLDVDSFSPSVPHRHKVIVVR